MVSKTGRPPSLDTMRIDPKNTVVSPVVAKTVRDPVVPKSQDNKESASVVELSSAATMAGAKASDSAAKVSRVRELLAKGEYKVDLDVLASRICEDEILGRSDS
jgi:anti-sigma28 factor (negative regulator of flagellin synthesis)